MPWLQATFIQVSTIVPGSCTAIPEIQEQKDPALLDTLFRSRMMGLFGFGTLHGKLLTERVSLYPREVLAAARRNIPVYKRYRHLLSEDCYHPDSPCRLGGGVAGRGIL